MKSKTQSSTTTVEALINEREAARRLGIGIATLRKWRWSGEHLAFVKIGRAVRYEPKEIARFIAERSFRSTSQLQTGANAGA